MARREAQRTAAARRWRAATLTALLALSAAGCTRGGHERPQFRPTYRTIACYGDVDVVLVVRHSCGELTVLEDRSHPNGPQLHLFVLTYYPPNRDPHEDPAVVVGDDLGGASDYGGHQPLTQRVDRVTYLLDARGTGHSLPTLACPEVDAADRTALATSDRTGLRTFVGAVTTCRARLQAQGIDVADFGLTAMAGDVEDLRVALHVKTWDVAAYGSTGRIAIEVLRQYGRHIRAAWLDSSQLQTPDETSYIRAGATAALSALFAACHNDLSCHRRYGNLRGFWQQTLARLTHRPATAQAAGEPPLRIDARRFVRGAVTLLGSSGGWAELPAAISQAAHGQFRAIAAALTTRGVYCAGYQAACNHTVSWGSYLSVLCENERPLGAGLRQPVNEAFPGVSAAYADVPYAPTCQAWRVPDATTAVAAPLRTSIPILLLTGRFDPYAPPTIVKDQLHALLPSAYFISLPNQSHNVLGSSECALHIRNMWINTPARAPVATACLSRQRLAFA